MNEKLTLQDLVDLLSKKAKITKKDADSFFREFFQLILERIYDNDLVRIKEFGTFKLVSVSSRESVNVNTGEKIEIPSHSKLSFVPDRALKDLVNKPFSQFETILLDDGAVVEISIDEDDEDVVEDEFVNEIADITNENIVEVEKLDKVEIATVEDESKLDLQEETVIDIQPLVKTKPKSSVKQAYSRSFVYTYTASADEQKSTSITVSLPKNDLQTGLLSRKKDAIQEVERVVENIEFPIELKDLPIVLEDTDDIIEEEAVDLNIVEEVLSIDGDILDVDVEEEFEDDKIEIERELVAPLLNEQVSLQPPLLANLNTINKLNLELTLDSQIEMEEDIIVQIPIVDVVQSATPSKTISEQVTLEKYKNNKFSNEDPERPLFPNEDEEVLEDLGSISLEKRLVEDRIEVDQDDENVLESLGGTAYVGNNKPTEIRGVSFSDRMDSVDIPYPDYSNTSPRSKIKKWLPVIFFFLVIVGFLTYGLIKMLQKPYDYEYYIGRTITDSLSEDVAPQIQETDALLDSMRRLQDNLKKDSTKVISRDSATPSESNLSEKLGDKVVKQNIIGTADSLTTDLLTAENEGLVISNNLRFGMLNKAQYHLRKSNSDSNNNAIQAMSQAEHLRDVSSSKQYATIQRGTTLRTIATASYGNPTYWVYIYQANREKISNPNSVPIGTKLLIPLLSDYGVLNSKDSKSIQVAKELESKIIKGV